MKTADKILIYDDACPMCTAYTKLFVQKGFLGASGRQSFSTIDKTILARIDTDKCRNEIPLINTVDNSVTYGIDAMLEILSIRIPLIKSIGSITPVGWLLKKLYNLISFNRRVITAGNTVNSLFDCAPAFNLKYRILFLFFGFSFNTLMLIPEYRHVFANSSFSKSTMVELQVTHFMLVMVNFILPVKLPFKHAIEFLGQVNMTALIYSLLLVPIIAVNKFIAIPFWLNNACLVVVFCIIIATYKRRMLYAGILQHRYIIIIDAIASALFVSFLVL